MPTRNDPTVAQPRVTFDPEDIEKALLRMRLVLQSGQVSKGPQADELEARLVDVAGNSRYALTVGSGGLALWATLLALRQRRGERPTILLPDIAHWSDYAAARLAGWRVLWAPVNRWGHLDIPCVMNSDVVPDAVMYVSIGGYVTPDLPALERWCREWGVELVCDMSHAVGATCQPGGQPALSFGTVAVASMFATKLVTSGEGGFVVTEDKALALLIAAIRDGGRRGPGWHDWYDELGVNARMSDLHAALGNVHLDSLPARLARRRQIAEAYDAGLPSRLQIAPWAGSSLYKYLVQVPDRQDFLARLDGVRPAAAVWDVPLWRQPGFSGRRKGIGSADHALEWAAQHVALPMHESLTDEQVRQVIERVVEAHG